MGDTWPDLEVGEQDLGQLEPAAYDITNVYGGAAQDTTNVYGRAAQDTTNVYGRADTAEPTRVFARPSSMYPMATAGRDEASVADAPAMIDRDAPAMIDRDALAIIDRDAPAMIDRDAPAMIDRDAAAMIDRDAAAMIDRDAAAMIDPDDIVRRFEVPAINARTRVVSKPRIASGTRLPCSRVRRAG